METSAGINALGSEKKGFHVMAKPIGSLCNLDCKYCFYLEKEKLYPGTNDWAMRDDVLETYIRQHIAAQPGDAASFAWQGGEPTLLGLDYFRRIIDLERKHAAGKRIENAIQTNAVALNAEWAQFFAEQDFLVGVSIDGPARLHDFHRVDKGQQPTFDRVMRGVEHLKAANVKFNTLTVVSRENSQHPMEVYRFLKEIGSHFLQFIPVVERASDAAPPGGLVLLKADDAQPARVTDWSVLPAAYGTFLCEIFDEWVRHDVGRTFVQIFDVALGVWVGRESSLCVFAETCGSALALEHQGDVYSCDHFVYPENRLGNIMDHPLESLASLPRQQAFGLAKRDSLPAYCRQCDVRFACNGECPKHRFATTPDGEAGLNYLCAAYKKFFHHVAPYMEFMGRELLNCRPPALVMDYAKWADEQVSHRGRDETPLRES